MRRSWMWALLAAPLAWACEQPGAQEGGTPGGGYGGGVGGEDGDLGGTDGGDGDIPGDGQQGLDAGQVIADWNEVSRTAAEQMILKYGDPDEIGQSLLIWYDNGPWLATVVYAEEIRHDFPIPHSDVLEQFVRYQVPPELFDDLALYDGSVIAERTKGVLSARCDQEGANFLALNLADEIVNGSRTWQQARDFYGQQISSFLVGEAAPYMDGLRFTPMAEDAGDPDETTIVVPGGGGGGGYGGGGGGTGGGGYSP